MRNDKRLISIRYTNGRVARIPRSRANSIVGAGQAKFISKTTWRAERPKVTLTLQKTKTEITKKQSDKAAERREEKKAKKAKEIPNENS